MRRAEKFFATAVDCRPRISIIYKNETRANRGGAGEAGRPPAGDRRHPARLAAAKDDPQPCQELRQMRERRRPPAGGAHRELSGRAHLPVGPAPRAGWRSAPPARQLSLLGHGVRVLTRIMKKITAIAGAAGTKLRDRSRSVKLRVLDIARAARSKAKPGRAKLNRAYGQLLSSTSRVVGQAKRFAAEIATGVKGASDVRKQLVLASLRQEIEGMVPLVPRW